MENWEKKGRVVGKSIPRLDGYLKARGKAKYTDDYIEKETYIAKIFRSTIANGIVKNIDVSKAEKLEGVKLVVTYKDVPSKTHPTSGHPYKLTEEHRDIEDKNILTKRIRYYGDEIAAVVATTEKIAKEAIGLIEVEYEEYEPILTPEDSLKQNELKNFIHNHGNVLASTDRSFGNKEDATEETAYKFSGKYNTPIVQHCHLEPQVSIGCMNEDGRIDIITPNQVPFTLQRIIAESLDIPWSKVRVRKPYVGGGFGSKQDPVVEPLLAFLCTKLEGKSIKLEYTREESFISRVRHGFDIDLKGSFAKDGRLISSDLNILSNNGAYASHGHAIAETAMTSYRQLYKQDYCISKATTVYTNLPVAGAMRGYGVPQISFAQDSMMDEAAYELGIDPIDIRKMNLFEEDFIDPVSKIRLITSGMRECFDAGRKVIKWDEKKEKYKNQTGDIRRGVGVGAFCYQSNTYPVQLEAASSRIAILQDGTFKLEIGATEIGQGSDTAFGQIMAETIGINFDRVRVETIQDTDKSPFDFGSYASRQTYVAGLSVRENAEIVKDKILVKASEILEIEKENLEINGDYIVTKENEELLSLDEFAKITYYDPVHFEPIRIDHSKNVKSNALTYGATFVDLEVDTKTGVVNINEIYNVHDSGKIINPVLAKGQVYGGQSMGLGFSLYEELLFDEKGKPLNNNLLDYKLMTMMDTPKLNVEFVETDEPTSAYGNKCIGEPPSIPQGPAIANAIFDAIKIRFHKVPITAENIYEQIQKNKETGGKDE